ncbi:MAG: tRNA (adenine(22)-N(1))-methyltransferase [Christensenellales bacterium]|jgi:tRNA (adenine22-N1)-methyltransferase
MIKSLIGRRLEAVLEMVPPAGTVLDIGCDHGHLDVALSKSGRKVIASDISEKSLDKARRRVERLGLQDGVQTRLGDGFEVVREGEAQSCVIAGMGGLIIAGIIQRGESAARAMHALVLQPMSDAGTLRKYLRENLWEIQDETLVREKGRIYAVMRVVSGQDASPGGAYDLIGWHNVRKKGPLAKALAQKHLAQRKKALEKLEGAPSDKARRRRRELMREIAALEDVIKWLR